MLLIYTFIQNYKNIRNQSIHFTSNYHVSFHDSELSIDVVEQPQVFDDLYGASQMKNIHLLVGKTGSGKTNIFQLIGMTKELRETTNLNSEDSYFFLYVQNVDGAPQYYIEICNMTIAGINDGRPRKDYRDVPEELRKYEKRWDALEAYYFQYEMVGAQRKIQIVKEPKGISRTMIVNGFDKNAFARCPYPMEKNELLDQDGDWLQRVIAPYSRTDVLYTCKFLRDYVQKVETGEIKKEISFVLHRENWRFQMDYPFDEKLLKHEYWTYGERRREQLEKELFGIPISRKKENAGQKVSVKEQFIHDLLMDYARYLRRLVEKISVYDKVDPSRKFSYPSLPDGKKVSVMQRIYQLAAYIDKKGENRTKGVVNQIAKDLQTIRDSLRVLDDKYFSNDTFSIQIEDIYSEENWEAMDKIFECMANYEPDDIGLFWEELLPHEFSHLSAGEYQYARVMGGIYEYGVKLTYTDGVKPDMIYLLDEPEVYMHPELCRRFIQKLYEILEEQNVDRNIQIILSTHSPFMLSDVFPEQITRLNIDAQSGRCKIYERSQKEYFAANIHTIMADGFFLDYTIGEFSRVRLQAMQDDMKEMIKHRRSLDENDRDRIERYKKVIPRIGDTWIRRSFEILLELLE